MADDRSIIGFPEVEDKIDRNLRNHLTKLKFKEIFHFNFVSKYLPYDFR